MTEKSTCGIVMPISAIDGCSSDHWAEVLKIIEEACNAASFHPMLVSDADESGIIQKRIVSNIYNSDLVVVDVSAKNPNVMFELGMRLAFDKPAIIIKDDKTSYSFDTGVIEHLSYPRDLHYYSILDFKSKLATKLTATLKASKTDTNYTTFLKHFGEYTVKNIENKEVSGNEYVLKAIEELRDELALTRRRVVRDDMFDKSIGTDEELMEVVDFFVMQFRRDNRIPKGKLIGNKEKIFEFLEEQNILRKLAGTRERLEVAMKSVLLRYPDA